jgi:hypothetical protein
LDDFHYWEPPVYGATTALTEQDLLLELERVEQAIARSTTFIRWVDTAGRSQVRIAEDLLTLAEREHAIVQELRRRRRLASTAL